MKLATFETGNGPELGAVTAHGIVPLSRAMPALGTDMIALIARWEEFKPHVAHLVAEPHEVLALTQVHLLAPVPRPGKIYCIGLNYADHIAEGGRETPKHQTWFTKPTTAVNGPYDAIEIPRVSQCVDYEVELVAVIGKGGRHITKENAAAHVFGYCTGNDVTERAWQRRSTQFCIGKGFDTHAPFGPWLTTADEAGDPHNLNLTCAINGDVRQNSNTRYLIFNVWDQIAELSAAMTLEPGDVIFTGTPGGVGGMGDNPTYLKDGDVVRAEVEGLGALEAVCKNEI